MWSYGCVYNGSVVSVGALVAPEEEEEEETTAEPGGAIAAPAAPPMMPSGVTILVAPAAPVLPAGSSRGVIDS